MHTQQSMRCLRCNTSQQSDINLHCGHTLCVVCLSFIVIKVESKQLPFPSSIHCPLCQQETLLNQNCAQIIKMTIQELVLPKFQETFKSSSEQSHVCSIQNANENLPQMLTRQSCSNQKLTGVTTMNQSAAISMPTKSLGSCRSSPKSIEAKYCNFHPFQQHMFSCCDCRYQLLCLKCFSDGRHATHNVKSIKATIQSCVQQLNFNQYQVSERKQLLQLTQRKLYNRKQLLQSRYKASEQKISESFSNIAQKLMKKQQQVINELKNCFSSIEEQINIQIQRVQDKISHYMSLITQIRDVDISQEPHSYIRMYAEMEDQLKQKQSIVSALSLLTKIPSNIQICEISPLLIQSIYTDIDKILFTQQTQLGLRINKSAQLFRIATDPSLHNKNHKIFRTQKTDWGQEELQNQNKFTKNFQNPRTDISISPHFSNFLSRQISCQNINKCRQQQASLQLHNLYESFTNNSKLRNNKEENFYNQRRERKTTGGVSANSRSGNTLEKMSRKQKQKALKKGLFQKKLKKVMNRNK